MNQGYEDKSPLRQTKEEKSITYSKDSIIETNPEKNLSSKDKEINTSSNANNIISTESKPENISDNSDPSNKKAKTKRHRRGKSIDDSRDFKCPECLRTYLSASALKNHRRMKHNFGVENEKKGRGRPKKEFLEEEYMNQTRKEYNNFLEEKKKKNDEKINFGFIKGVFDDLFNRYKNELFGSIESIEKNTFFILFKENWEKDNNSTNLDMESYSSMINCSPAVAIVNKPPIDCIFFQYIKFISNIIEKDYVVFILKFIIIFRQYINIEKKSSINSEYITKEKTEYTQIYDSSVIPDFFNDFLVDFMENRNYFFLDKDELVKIIEYFCFWLFLEGYTDSHIAKVD
jgi:hypothetical protein